MQFYFNTTHYVMIAYAGVRMRNIVDVLLLLIIGVNCSSGGNVLDIAIDDIAIVMEECCCSVRWQ